MNIIEKLSSYNFFNYLLPGVLFVVITDVFTKYSFIQSNLVLGEFVYYFIGLVISRFGSLVLEPILKRVADAGIESFTEAAAYAPQVRLALPGIDRFQAPHHGSRRNVSTALLDQWLGPRLANPLIKGQESFTAFISSAKEDGDHPRKAVIRGLIYRGGNGFATEGRDISTQVNAPRREGWSTIAGEAYPEEQEE